MQGNVNDPSIGLLVAATRRRLKQVIWSRLVPFNLTPQQFWVILHLHQGRAMSLHELAKNIWAGADLRQILLAELKPYDGEKESFMLAGPDLFVSSRAAVVLGMVFHELATNAAKYGALANNGGNVQVRWATNHDGDGTFLLEWQERGGPDASSNNRQGFGLKFIERSVSYELQGSAEVAFDPAGLRVSISAPMAELVGDGGSRPRPANSAGRNRNQ